MESSLKEEQFIPSNNIPGEFTLTKKLMDLVLCNMPEDFSVLEKAYYIYRRLCDMFHYDEEYFCYSNGSSVFKNNEKPYVDHNDINRLSLLEGNEGVICTEITMLYSKFLEYLNIPYQILNYKDEPVSDYGTHHLKARLKIDDYIIDADAGHGVFNSDMSAVKIFQQVNSFITVNNISLDSKQEFYKKLRTVDNYYKSVHDINEFNDALEVYENTYVNNKKVSFMDKVNIFKDIIKMPKCPFIVMFSWVKELEEKIFGVSNTSCHAEFLITNQPTNKDRRYELVLAIIYNDQDNLYEDVLTNTYIIINEDRQEQELDMLGFYNKINNETLDYTSIKRKKLFNSWEEEYESNRFGRL